MGSVPVTNGTKSLFATHRIPAWHGMAEPFNEEVTDFERMLELANMNNIKYWFAEAAVVGHEDARFITPTLHVMWKNPLTNQVEVLGTVGERYEIIDLHESFKFLASLGAGKRWETAGIINDGRVAFGAIAFERETVLDPSGVADVVKNYLLMSTSFDGSSGLRGGRTAVRVVCENTLNMAWGDISSTFNIRHTLNYAKRMAEVEHEMNKTDEYFDAAEAEAQALFQKRCTDDQFWNIVKTLFPAPEADKKGAQTKWDKKIELISQAWKGEPNEGIRFTAWGALNALTEANQWGRNVQTGRANGQENFWKAGAGFDTSTNTFRQNVLEMVKAI